MIVYFISLSLMIVGLMIIVMNSNNIKKLFGLSIFQNSVLLFYIALAFVENSAVPIYSDMAETYTNPLPHVLMLTAIVVGVATFAVGLALLVKMQK